MLYLFICSIYHTADCTTTNDEPPTQSPTPAATPVVTRSNASPTLTPTHTAVKQFLNHLKSTEIRNVGVNLGLSFRKLKSIREEDIPDETISRWLREDDDVTETSGHPSWQSLVQALEEAGYNGVVANIRKGMHKKYNNVVLIMLYNAEKMS